MKHLMLTLLAMFIINSAHALEVQATGYGSSYDEAVQSAKTTAVEQATGTFVTGKRELNNGEFSENMAQYNGALINRVDVKSVKITNGLYEVTITARVSTDKINSFTLVEPTAAPKSSQVTQLLDAVGDRQKVINAFTNISNIAYPFVVTSFAANDYKMAGGTIEITHYSRVQWNTKWIDDVLKLVKVIDQPMSEDTRAAICIDNDCYSVPALPAKFGRVVGYQLIERHTDGSPDKIVATSGFYVNDFFGRESVNLLEYREDTHIIYGMFGMIPVSITPSIPTLQIWTDKVNEHHIITKISASDLKHIAGFTHVLDKTVKRLDR